MRRSPRYLFVPLLFIVVACAGSPKPKTEPGKQDKEQQPLIPRAVLFDNPEKSSATISPDGTYLAYIAPLDGVNNIWVQPTAGSEAKAVTKDTKRGIRIYFWAENSKHLLYLQDTGGDENYHLHRVDPASGEVKNLTPYPGVQASVVELSAKKPDEILIQLNKRDRSARDVYRLNLLTGETTEDTQNPGDVMRWLADDQLRVRAASSIDGEGNTIIRVRTRVQDKWRELVRFAPLEDGFALSFSADGNSLLMVDNARSDTQRFYAMALKDGAVSEIFQDPSADFVDAMIHPINRTVEAVATERLRKKWHLIDQSLAKDLDTLRQLRGDDFTIVSRSKDDQLWVVLVEGDTTGRQYYLYRRQPGSTELLFDTRPALRKYQLQPMQPVEITSRDGLSLVSYLTKPVAAQGKTPMVLLVHGGPWSRDQWGYDPVAQWLANRGYAVLQVNFRGSTGFGKNFLNAGNKQWGKKMQDDLTDAVAWAVANANVDPKRVAIMGGSYGGYAALAGVTFTPDLYAAAVDVVGPSNIITLLNSIPPYWKPLLAKFQVRVGDLEKDKEMLQQQSPLSHADKIKTPLFIFQGANDPRVKQAESDQIVKAIRDRKGRVDYVVYTDEGHGFRRPPNKIDYLGRTEVFLAEHLGGQAEPYQKQDGSSAEVR